MTNFILPDKVYDVLKWVALVFLPALAVLVFSIGEALGVDTGAACAIISAVAVFIGSLIGVSALNLKKKENEE